jgi:hypothetical protein
MDIKEKRKTFCLSRWMKSKFAGKAIPDPGVERNSNIESSLASADEWPLQEDGYHTYTKFNNEGFYN